MSGIFSKLFLQELAAGAIAYPSHGSQDPDRAARWVAAFAGRLSPAVAAAAARRYPATSAELFGRWLALKTSVTPEEIAAEPVLQPDDTDRLGLRPLRFPWMWKFRTDIESVHWIAGEISLKADREDIARRLKPAEKQLIWSLQAFLNYADTIVMKGLDEAVAPILPSLEAQGYLRAQGNQEATHGDAYSLMVEIVPAEKRREIEDSARFNPAVGRMIDWVNWWIDGDHPPCDVFAAMAQLEGTLFSGMFAAIQFFKSRGLLAGLTGYNELISRDEWIHTKWWCRLLKELRRGPDRAVAEGIAVETVALSDEFFLHAMPPAVAPGAPSAEIEGLNLALVRQHVRKISDDVMGLAGLPKNYGAASPFGFMDRLKRNRGGKTNFFEGEATQYQGIGEGDLDFEVDWAKTAAGAAAAEPAAEPAT